MIVLSDEPTADPARARAGRPRDRRPWDSTIGSGTQAAGASSGSPARSGKRSGLRTVFHHHCAAYVETPAEIDALMERPIRRWSVSVWTLATPRTAGAIPRDFLSRHRARVWHVHFKDCEPAIAAERARRPSAGTTRQRFAMGCSVSSAAATSTSPALLARSPRPASTAGSSSSRTCCRRWARRWPARPATASISGRLGSEGRDEGQGIGGRASAVGDRGSGSRNRWSAFLKTGRGSGKREARSWKLEAGSEGCGYRLVGSKRA